MQTIQSSSIEKRVNALRNKMREKEIDATILWDPDNEYYISGFRAISYSRPILLLVYQDKTQYILPALEEEHAKLNAHVDEFYIYYETYPHREFDTTYIQPLNRILSDLPKQTTIGLEMELVPASFAKMFESKSFHIKDVTQDLIDLRAIKDEEEIYWLEQAGHLSDVALKASFNHLEPGMSELEFDSHGDRALLEEASKEYPNHIIGYENWTCSGIERSAMPHLYSSTRKYDQNDVVVHSRQVWINGYRAENERTFLLGEPTNEQRNCLQLAIDAQQAGFDAVKPGVKASEVDIASYKVFEDAGYGKFVQHRIGHGLGLTEHEEPYLRFDNDLVLQEGMVYTIEPGIYVPGVGGFRHSDTVIVTKDGCHSITKYPRDLESLLF
ncbi:aminopeptidase P family protein [Halalkalibacillus sediminis]|uniref:Aminopeptidase P family protein n=1 Tax=Halalkalibacillus sediminis TaxID=2018042 RepID=A0A2I0QTI6_9BACI|nr:Xaa-Pro peptidase family protein [Halalkalibacillus sediminis]PKR77651.1 aminopeptidase P family protein [Halalkalibacillus sediminis]